MILFFADHPTQVSDENSEIRVSSRDVGLEQKNGVDTDGNWCQKEDTSSSRMDLGMYK